MAKMYDLMEAIGRGNTKEYLKGDLSETYEHVKIARRATSKALKCIGKTALKGAYPLLGNLSEEVQIKLEETVGRENYDSANATTSSAIVNCAIYPIMGALGNSYGLDINAFPLFLMGIVEAGIRIGPPQKNLRPLPCASLPGKIVSLPLEAMIGIYDGVKGRKNKKRNFHS